MTKQLDQEWIDLIIQAKLLGLTVEDVQNFINSNLGGNPNDY